MFYILSAHDYSALIALSDIKQNYISQAVYNPDINSKTSFTRAKSELSKLGLVKKGVITTTGRLIMEAVLDPERVVSVVSCNSIDMATAHYCFSKGFWLRLLPKNDHSIITIESPIEEKDLVQKIRRDFLQDFDFTDTQPIDVFLTVKEVVIFQLMQLAIVDKVRKKGAPLTRAAAALGISEFITNKNVLDAAAAAYMLGEKAGYELSRQFWDTNNVISHIDALVGKNIFDKVIEQGTGKLKYIMSDISRKWLTLDCLVDKITIQKLPQGDIINVSITKSGMMTVTQNAEGLRFKTITINEFYEEK